jgi:acetyl-CoA carboxylase carboxyl transferase subunit alpha
MGITSERLKDLGLIDGIIPEPLGGAHRDPDTMARNLKIALNEALEHLETLPTDKLLEERYSRLMSYGAFSS